ncbi:hypothetical protein AM440_07320 [Escherichia coli]|nr:hypothetical protein AM440_07320 [Escherichia coli]
MRKPEILYKQPILWHFSVFRGNGFSVSGKRLAITTNIMRFNARSSTKNPTRHARHHHKFLQHQR